MKTLLTILLAFLGMGWSLPSAQGSTITSPSPFYRKNAARIPEEVPFRFPPAFEPERGVSWDGRIGWKTEERALVFAAALEGSLKGISRVGSPYRLIVNVLRAEKQTGTFVVEFSIEAPTGESLELVQVEGVCPRNHSTEQVYPAVAGEIVNTFEKSVLK